MNDPLLESGLKQKQDKSKNNSNNRMRGGGPRMVCSPYFVTGVFILLVIVTMRYWSLSSQNTALTDRLERLQIKLKSTSYDLEDLHSKLAKQEDEVKACLDKMEKDEAALKDTWAEKVVDVERERDACRGDLDQAKRGLEECSEAKAEAEARLEAAQRDKEETLGLRNSDVEEKEERIREKDEEIRGLKEKLEQSLGEINSLKNAEAEKIKIQAESLDNSLRVSLKPGELPDVDPAAVHIGNVAVRGMQGHLDDQGRMMPILPRGDPDKPRRRPEVSVNQINSTTLKTTKSEDEEVRDDVNAALEEKDEGPQDVVKEVNPDAAEADVDDNQDEGENDDDQDPNGDIQVKDNNNEEEEEEDDDEEQDDHLDIVDERNPEQGQIAIPPQ